MSNHALEPGDYRAVGVDLRRPVVDAEKAALIRRSFPVVHVNGWALLEHPGLRFDEVRLDTAAHTALVGEIRHVMYQSDIDTIKQAMRNDLFTTMAMFAQRVGVAYPLTDD